MVTVSFEIRAYSVHTGFRYLKLSNKMKTQLTTAILLLNVVSIGFSQNEFTIDFEEIPNAAPSEGLNIGDQFLDAYGISFALEDGNVPVLAKVGSPTTAFQSSYGSDTPAPGENIGDYFLTDDGELSGLDSPPLLITSENPIQKISGEVLDIDFGEFFIIEAMDINGTVVQSDTIESGDSDTGDGVAANWEFEVSQCIGVYSIRLEGKRETAGAFGLGLDNFFIQLLELNPEQLVNIETDSSDCMMSNGSIRVVNNSSSDLTYSIDGVNFQATPIFQNLPFGNYTVYIQNDLGCTGTLETSIESEGFVERNISQEICEDETFDFLGEILDTSGVYTSVLAAENGCDTMVTLELNQLANPVSTFTYQGCEGDGFSAIIGGTVYDETNPTGQEILTAESGCDSVVNVDLSFGSSISFALPRDTLVAMGDTVRILPPSFHFEPDALLWSTNIADSYCSDCPVLDILPLRSGQISLTVIDTNGCRATSTLELVLEPLRVYIPNSFSPNRDGINDRFRIYTNYQGLSIVRFEVYDRWGGRVFSQDGIRSDLSQAAWDGTLNGRELNTGLYVYLIEVETASGGRKHYAGEVHLLK